MATPGYRSNNGMKPQRTPQQQRNVESRQAMNNNYATQARLGSDPRSYAPKPGISIPGAPQNSLQHAQSNYAAAHTPIKKPGMFNRMSAFVGRQFR